MGIVSIGFAPDNSSSPQSTFCCVATCEEKGKIVVAARFVEGGTTVVLEKPVFVYNKLDNSELYESKCPSDQFSDRLAGCPYKLSEEALQMARSCVSEISQQKVVNWAGLMSSDLHWAWLSFCSLSSQVQDHLLHDFYSGPKILDTVAVTTFRAPAIWPPSVSLPKLGEEDLGVDSRASPVASSEAPLERYDALCRVLHFNAVLLSDSSYSEEGAGRSGLADSSHSCQSSRIAASRTVTGTLERARKAIQRWWCARCGRCAAVGS